MAWKLFVAAAALLGLFITVSCAPTSAVSRSRVGTRTSATTRAAGHVLYSPPVDAPVLEAFQAPTSPYGPGNRGIDYAVRPGTVVRAAADGTVTFAGQVAGELYVTVRHADGIRTSYSYLAQLAVHSGQTVIRGQELGTTTGRFQIGARAGDVYVDPASLWAGVLRVRLVPLEG